MGTIRPPIKNENPQRSPYRHPTQRNDGLRNESCTTINILSDDSLIWGSSSSLDTIRPPERPPYWRDGLHNSASNHSHVWGSSSSLNTIRPINHENPQLLPYPSSTKVDRVHNRLHHVTQALHCVIADQIVYNSSTSLKIKI